MVCVIISVHILLYQNLEFSMPVIFGVFVMHYGLATCTMLCRLEGRRIRVDSIARSVV